LSPVSAASANGVAWLTSYAARVRSSLAILVTLVACVDHDAERLIEIKTKVCACKTASCAEQEMKLVPERAIKSTHRTQEIARELLDCVAKLRADERPTTDPDAPDEDEPAGDTAGSAPPAIAPPASAPPAIAPPAIAPPPAETHAP